MKPGSKLDIAVAKIMGWANIDGIEGTDLDQTRSIVLDYSTSMNAAMQAFEWLEQNHPWGPQVHLSLCRGGVRRESPSVRLSQIGKWGEIIAHREIIGESYAHAICLAALLATVETGF